MKWKLSLRVLFAAVLAVAVPYNRAQNRGVAEKQLQAAQQKEQVEGDLKAAIRLYEQVANSKDASRSTVADAWLRIGRCYEKLGSAEARKAYERVARQYADQSAAAAEASRRLSSLNGPTQRKTGELVVRKLSDAASTRASSVAPPSSISADGRYTTANEAFQDILLMDLVSGQQRPLRKSAPLGGTGEMITTAAISPNAKQVAYTASFAGGGELRLINTDGSGLQVLQRVEGDDPPWLVPMDWSADGKSLLIRRYTYRNVLGETQFTILDVATRRARTISTSKPIGRRAKFSPDGRVIAFAADAPADDPLNVGIHLIRTDGTGEQVLLSRDSGADLIGWSPDGSKLAYVAARQGVSHIWAQRIQDGKAVAPPEVLVGDSGGLRNFMGITSSGDLLYSVMEPNVGSFTAVLNPSTGMASSREQFQPGVNAMVVNPVWSPNGRMLSYGQLRDLFPMRQKAQVMVRDLSTGADRLVAELTFLVRGLSWAPDGRSFVSAKGDPDDVYKIYRIDAASGQVSVLADVGKGRLPIYPRLGPDGNTLFYILLQSGQLSASPVIRVDLATGERTTVATSYVTYSLSADGSQLAVIGKDVSKEAMALQIVPSSGGTPRQIFRSGNASERITSIAWMPDGQHVIFAKEGSSGSEFFRISAGGGEPSPVGLKAGKGYPDIQIRPDGRQIAFMESSTKNEIWVMENLLPGVDRRARRDLTAKPQR